MITFSSYPIVYPTLTVLLTNLTHRNPQENIVMELIQGADRSKWMVHSNHSITCFTKGEIEIITDKYNTILGRGAFGEVY